MSVWFAIALAAAPPPVAAPLAAPPSMPASYVEALKKEAPPLLQTVQHSWVREVFARVVELPPKPPVVLHRHRRERDRYLDAAAFAGLDAAAQADWETLVWTDEQYYAKWSTPLAYARVVDVAADHGLGGLAGKKVVDFGYGDIAVVDLFARAGARAIGVDPHPALPLLYSRPGDEGPRPAPGAPGSVTLVHERWPLSADAVRAVGGGVDVFFSKNTLKKGYVHPSQPVDPKKTLQLGVSDAAFVGALYDALNPGGLVVIYNLCPAKAPPGGESIPWSEGESPFSKTQYEAAGFVVSAFDIDDTAAARRMARVLGWDKYEEKMDIDRNLYAWFTVLQKPAKTPTPTPK